MVFNWMYDIDDGGKKKWVKYNSIYTLIDKQKWRIPTKHIKKTYVRNIILLFYCTATHKYQYGKSFKFVTDTIEMVVIVRKLGLQLQSNLYSTKTADLTLFDLTLIKPMLKKIANQNIVSNIYNVLIGWFYIWITRLKLTLDTFMTVQHVLS